MIRSAAPGALLVLVLAVVLGALCAPTAVAASNEAALVTPANCRNGAPHADGTTRQPSARLKDASGLSGIPPRHDITFDGGRQQQVCVGFQNRSATPADLVLRVDNVGVDEKGAPFSRPEDASYGAGDWVTLPTRRARDVQPGEIAWLLVDVDVPTDAVAGSWYASIMATQVAPQGGAANQVTQAPAVIVQLFFNIPGDGTRGGDINEVRAPRVVWWDGWKVSSIRFMDRFRGQGIAPVRFTWRNGGDYSDTRGGQLVVSSSLTGKVVERVDIPEKVVLRGSERDFEAIWKRNIPMVGRFTAVIEMRGSDGSTEKHELPAIWVVPAWWYLLLVLAAFAVPLALRRRSRRRYDELMARVEAAEARSGGAGPADEWDQDWDSSSDRMR
jgi:hypothetical protein